MIEITSKLFKLFKETFFCDIVIMKRNYYVNGISMFKFKFYFINYVPMHFNRIEDIYALCLLTFFEKTKHVPHSINIHDIRIN